MKILCVIDSLGSGGAQRQLVSLALGFKERGCDVFFLTYHNINFYEEELVSNDIKIKTIIESNYILRIVKFRRYIRDSNFNAVIAFLTGPSFICEISSLPFRKWSLIVGERSANPEMFSSAKWRFYRLFHGLADYVVANSHANIEMVKKMYPRLKSEKYQVIYNLVDLAKWKTSSSYIPKRNGKLHLLIVSSHQYLKNLDGLIEAVSLLSASERELLNIDWYGEVLDDSLEMGMNKIKVRRLDSIFNFHPATKNIHAIVAQSDVIGLFSFYEGLPNSLCEGMASGKAVIASRVSDNVNLVRDIRFTFDPNSGREISDVIRTVIGLTPEELLEIGKKNKTFARSAFDRDNIVSSYLQLLNFKG